MRLMQRPQVPGVEYIPLESFLSKQNRVDNNYICEPFYPAQYEWLLMNQLTG